MLMLMLMLKCSNAQMLKCSNAQAPPHAPPHAKVCLILPDIPPSTLDLTLSLAYTGQVAGLRQEELRQVRGLLFLLLLLLLLL